MGDMPSAADMLTLTNLLDWLGRSLDRLEGAAYAAATDSLHLVLVAVRGQLHRGGEAAAKLQGLYAEPEAKAHTHFSISILLPQPQVSV